MPDRPGALGQVASRIGAVRGDVLAIEILEHGAGQGDRRTRSVSLPDENLIALLTAEIDAVDGVSVESIRRRRRGPHRPEPGRARAVCGARRIDRDERSHVLCAGIARIVEADWVAVLRRRWRGGGAPASHRTWRGWLRSSPGSRASRRRRRRGAERHRVGAPRRRAGPPSPAAAVGHPIRERERVPGLARRPPRLTLLMARPRSIA